MKRSEGMIMISALIFGGGCALFSFLIVIDIWG